MSQSVSLLEALRRCGYHPFYCNKTTRYLQ